MTDDTPERIDKTPDGSWRQASQQASGEVFSEYGVVDLSTNFPSRTIDWNTEPREAPNERHVVVPFRVVKRGIKNRRSARSTAEAMNEEEGHDRYKAVLLSDMRGM